MEELTKAESRILAMAKTVSDKKLKLLFMSSVLMIICAAMMLVFSIGGILELHSDGLAWQSILQKMWIYIVAAFFMISLGCTHYAQYQAYGLIRKLAAKP